jgi:hypothetical protein
VFRGGSYQTAHENACHTARHHTQPSLSWNKSWGRAIDADDAAIDAAAVIDELLFQPRATGKKHKGFRVNKMETLVVCKSQWKSYLTRNGWMRVWISPYCDDVFLIIICFIFTINRHCYAAQLWLLGLVSPVHHVVLTLSAPPKSEEWVCSAATPPRWMSPDS